jgi:diguanylate cyclase (GGDEF)-like protein/PAS domain S-box-containing protein
VRHDVRQRSGRHALALLRRRATALIRAAVEASSDAILAVTPHGRPIAANTQFRELWNVPPGPLPGSERGVLEAARELVLRWDLIESRLRGSGATQIPDPAALRLRDGRTIRCTLSPLRLRDGTPPFAWFWIFRDITESRRAESLRSALFRIAEITQVTDDLSSLYAAVHRVIGEQIDATNFYIAIHDEKGNGLWFPYYVDQVDPKPETLVPVEGLTGYVLRTGKALLVDRLKLAQMFEEGIVEEIGTRSVDWLGVPLKSGDKSYGVIGVQSYDESVRYTEEDLELLGFVSRHISSAIEHRRKEVALQRSEEKYRSIFDFAPVGIYQSSLDGRILTANNTMARMLGYDSVDELLRLDLTTDVYFSEDERRKLLDQFLPIGRAFNCEVLWKKKDGSPIWIQLNSHAVTGRSGQVLHFEGFIYDITARRDAEEIMRTQSVAMEASMDGIAILSGEGLITYANEAFLRLFGCHSDRDLLRFHWRSLVEPAAFRSILREAIRSFSDSGTWRGESSGLTISGMTFPAEVSLARIANNGIVVVVRDVTERTHAAEQIRHLAYHDALTGLPNRLLLRDRLTVAISQTARAGRRLAVLFFDLDRFKVINDSLGHNVGDLLLQAVAHRLEDSVRDSDTVARLGGDEFTVILPMLAESDDAARLAEKILETIREPLLIGERQIFITTSIGVSIFPDDGEDPGTLIRNADTAMYQAKETGRDNYKLFNAELNARSMERLALENDIRRAVAEHQFVVYYQPLLDFDTGRVSGMEALVRWDHPHLGLLEPSSFITIAESIGLMPAIGEGVLETAARQTVEWIEAGRHDLCLSVNLSPRQLQDDDLPNRIARILDRCGLPAGRLTLEVTESMAMANPEGSREILHALREQGISVAIDDFGTGHSALAYLRRFPVDVLKIDKSFIEDIDASDRGASIVTGIIALAHKLGFTVVAEGVETDRQRRFLAEQECDQLQGFLVSRPLPPEQFFSFVSDWTADWSTRPR